MLIIHSKNHRLTIGPRVLVISGPISEDNKYGFRRQGKKYISNFIEVLSWCGKSKYEAYIEGWKGKCPFLLSYVSFIS